LDRPEDKAVPTKKRLLTSEGRKCLQSRVRESYGLASKEWKNSNFKERVLSLWFATRLSATQSGRWI